MAEQSRGRRSAVLAGTAAAFGATLLGLAGAAGAAAAPKAAPPKCSVQFTASDVSPAVGQNITLSWASSGADELVASWTTAHVPFTGTQVTTKNTPGPASYQVTGLKSGQYCGGGVVNVVFAAAAPPSSSAPLPTTSSAAPSSSASSPSSAVASATSSAAATATASATYPAQSPTSGSPTPWYAQPLDLLVLGLLCLFASVALMNRDRLRALLARRH
jgi:hypothetical protein